MSLSFGENTTELMSYGSIQFDVQLMGKKTIKKARIAMRRQIKALSRNIGREHTVS